jgi:hypothetical protein
MNLLTATKLALLPFFSFLSLTLFAGTIKGKVADAKTAEPLAGATVSLEDTKYKTIVNLDGSFVLRNIPSGNYEIRVKMIGYEKFRERNIIVTDNNAIDEVSFALETESKELAAVSVTGKSTGETDKGVRI